MSADPAGSHAFSDRDALVDGYGHGMGQGWFDRFYFNAFRSGDLPYVLLGAGKYPDNRVMDGYVVVVANGRQFNLRLSDSCEGDTMADRIGPLSWQTIEPMKSWRMVLEPNAANMSFDLTWTASAGFFSCDPIRHEDGKGNEGQFEHGFQSGTQNGWIEVDGNRWDIHDWIGNRDRSKGTRLAMARHGVHTWMQAHFADLTIGLYFDIDRNSRPSVLDGGVISSDGTQDAIVSVGHDLDFSKDLELTGGRLRLTTKSGQIYELHVRDATVAGGGYMAGAGYGGWHGKPRGRNFAEHEIWTLRTKDVDLRKLVTPMADRLVSYSLFRSATSSPEQGVGIFEFAHSRSDDYLYKPSI